MDPLEMNKDKEFLTRAIEIALSGISSGGGPFGAVLTRNGKIISESNNRVVLLKDPTAHAEILVIRQAARLLGTHDLSSCILYSSCEPCPMCLAAIYWSGIKRIVYSSDRNDVAAYGFSDSFIYKEICLDPSDRQITFQREIITGAQDVFKKWEEFVDKICY